MRILVTGSTGFIGGFLVEELLAQGHEIVCLIRKTSSTKYLPREQVKFVQGTLESPESLARAVDGVQMVFHLAGATRVLHKDDFYRINAEGTRHLLEACSQGGKDLQRFVLVSSLAAAGPCQNGQPVTEVQAPHPVSHYGRSKLAAEQFALEYAGAFPVTIVRPPVVYGPRDQDVYAYFKQVKAGIALQLGRKPRHLSLIHVQDLVRGIVQAGFAGKAIGQTYFITNAEAKTWSELGTLISQALGKKCIRLVVPVVAASLVAAVSELMARIRKSPALLGFDKIHEMRHECWVCSGEKAARELDFRPQIAVEEGIRQTARWYERMGWL